MHVRLLAALALVLGLLSVAAPGFRLLADRRDSTIADEPCIQDFSNRESPDPRVTVVMCGLDNPRGLAFFERRQATDDRNGDDGGDSDAALYVAEAGVGGFGPEPPQKSVLPGLAPEMRDE